MFKRNCLLPRLMMRLQKISFCNDIKIVGWPFIFQFPGSKIEFGKEVTINSNFWSNLLGLYQRTIIISRYGGTIRIGDHVGMSGCTIYAWDSIEIGDNTIIGANVKIIDNDFHPLDPDARLQDNKDLVSRKPVSIGKNVFIGMNSIILKGTSLGNNCVVGAGSVVSGKYPDNVIIAGNPAGIVRTLEEKTSI